MRGCPVANIAFPYKDPVFADIVTTGGVLEHDVVDLHSLTVPVHVVLVAVEQSPLKPDGVALPPLGYPIQ